MDVPIMAGFGNGRLNRGVRSPPINFMIVILPSIWYVNNLKISRLVGITNGICSFLANLCLSDFFALNFTLHFFYKFFLFVDPLHASISALSHRCLLDSRWDDFVSANICQICGVKATKNLPFREIMVGIRPEQPRVPGWIHLAPCMQSGASASPRYPSEGLFLTHL